MMKEMSLTRALQLKSKLRKRGYIKKTGEIQMAGQCVPLLAVHQNLSPRDTRNIGGESFDQRRHCEFFHQDSGAVAVGESGVEINHRQPRIHQINVADFRTSGQFVRRRFVEIDIEQCAQ